MEAVVFSETSLNSTRPYGVTLKTVIFLRTQEVRAKRRDRENEVTG
jgi:hypothetical protein